MEGPKVQTKTEIQAVLMKHGLRPKRRFGQHFLIDGNLMRRLVDSAEIRAGDLVLEVGPGTGGLTDLLVTRAGAVVAVEIDRALAAIMADRFADVDRLVLVQADALDTKNRLAPIVLKTLRDAACQATGRLMLVANLPYDVATPLLVNLLLARPDLARMCFTVQREVGERIDASPGTKAYGPLAVILQTACTVALTTRVPATAFWPRPAVESSMYRLDVRDTPFDDAEGFARFVALVRGSFLHRRKTLRYNLSQTVGDTGCEQAASVVDLGDRPETVAPDVWVQIAKATAASIRPPLGGAGPS
jgi:16S rRNA (adenine1518-N6/adenine1519-N6)-dimethyltransferase